MRYSTVCRKGYLRRRPRQACIRVEIAPGSQSLGAGGCYLCALLCHLCKCLTQPKYACSFTIRQEGPHTQKQGSDVWCLDKGGISGALCCGMGAVTRSGCVWSEGQGDGQGQGQGQGPRESGGRWTGTARATRTGSDRRSGQRAFDLQPIGLPCSREYCVWCVCVPAECVQCVVVVLHTPKAALGNGAGSKAGWL